jgi:hypothetical protein
MLSLSLADATLDERKPQPGRQKSLDTPLRALPLAAGKRTVPRSAHLRESRTYRRGWLLDRCHACLFSSGHRVTRLFSADICSHIISPRRAESHYETCCGLQRGERLGAQGDPHVRPLHTLRRARRIRAAQHRDPGPNLPVHGGVDTDASTLAACVSADTRANRSPSTSFLAACHRLSAAVTLVSPDISRMSGGLMLEHGQAVPTRSNLGSRASCGDCSSVFADRRPLRERPIL